MKLVLKFYGSLCATETFKINGIDADHEDFGDKEDACPENAKEYCCGDMRFTSKPSTEDILNKYKISVNDYYEICEKLEEGLSFGCCGWCS